MGNELIIHVVDDDEGARASITALLNSNGIPNRSYENAELFLDACPHLKTGCVVTDVSMPGRSGLELLANLTQPGKAVSVIVITSHANIPLAVEAMKRGAYDFLEKPLDTERFLASVQSAYSKVRDHDEREAERADAMERIAHLSPREREVLDGLVLGKPNKVIAFELNISPRTVEIYRANIMQKVQAASLSKLIRLTLLATGRPH
jgi:two-component system response regulator FixJ